MIDKATDLELLDGSEWDEIHDESIERYLEGGVDSSNAEDITLALFGRYEKTKDPALLAAAWMLGRCVDAAPEYSLLPTWTVPQLLEAIQIK
jgi:hypothetical protein